MKTIYNFWGHLSDKIGISSPDGNATYSPWIINELITRGHKVYCGIDRDKASVEKYGRDAFASFSQDKRWKVYNQIEFLDFDNLPEDVDTLLLEWRFKTKDNQLSKNDKNYSPDLELQNKLLDFYSNKDTKVIIMDLDYPLIPPS